MNNEQIKGYKGVVFDLDGTLLDTLTDLTNAVNHAMTVYNLPVRSQEEIRSFVGNGIRKLVILCVEGGEEHPDFELIFNAFKDYYDEHKADNTKPYDGVLEVMADLQALGYKQAIVSNKINSGVAALNDQYFSKYVTFAMGETEGIPRKPDKAMVHKCLEVLGLEPHEAVYIGDSEVDLLTASNAGLDCIAVTWGFRDEDFLIEKGAKTIAHDMAELMHFIRA